MFWFKSTPARVKQNNNLLGLTLNLEFITIWQCEKKTKRWKRVRAIVLKIGDMHENYKFICNITGALSQANNYYVNDDST